MALPGAPAQNLIGSRVSVVSHHDMRYEGTLHSVDLTDASVVMLDGKQVAPF
jgi:small nuclear ribonucleoprotein (snRNP)-like protein